MPVSVNTVMYAKASQCTNLLLNNFTQYPINSINGRSGDDNTMFQLTPNKDSQTITLTPKDKSSYYFERGICPDFQFNYKQLELTVTTFAPGTFFAINFQTSDSCDGAVTNNYVNPFKDNQTLVEAGKETKVVVGIPSGLGNKLVAVSIEDLQPLKVGANFGKMTLVCDNSAVKMSGYLFLAVLLFL